MSCNFFFLLELLWYLLYIIIVICFTFYLLMNVLYRCMNRYRNLTKCFVLYRLLEPLLLCLEQHYVAAMMVRIVKYSRLYYLAIKEKRRELDSRSSIFQFCMCLLSDLLCFFRLVFILIHLYVFILYFHRLLALH